MAEIDTFATQVLMIISSLRSSLNPISASNRLRGIQIDDVARFAGAIEQIRFRYSASIRLDREEADPGTYELALADVKSSLDELLSINIYMQIADGTRFRPQPPNRSRLEYMFDIDKRFGRSASILETVMALSEVIGSALAYESFDGWLRERIKSVRPELPIEEISSSDIQHLKRIVPAQKIAPIRFSIENDRIIVEKSNSTSAIEDKANIATAKSEILANGDSIIEHLKKSNCDKRLIENIEQLHSQISNDANAIQIGISNIGFGIMASTFKSELPDAVSAMLQSHNLSIGMYAAQFADWVRFSENASAAEISEADVTTVKQNANYIIDYLSENPDIADPKVISVFKQLGTLVRDPSRTSKKAAFAVIRTMENLLSKTFHYAINFFEQTASEVSKAASKTAAIIIVSFGLTTAINLISVSESLPELSWLKNAIELVQKQMKLPK